MKELQISRKVYTRDELIISEVTTGYAVELDKSSKVGIVWNDETKTRGLLLETEKGVCVLNNDGLSIVNCGFLVNKSSYLLERKSEIKEVYIFKSAKRAYKWLAKRKQ